MYVDDITAKPVDVTGQKELSNVTYSRFAWISFSYLVMQQMTGIDALGDDRPGHQSVLDVTYRYPDLHGGFQFRDTDVLLLQGMLFPP